MNFTLPPDLLDLQARTRRFIAEHIIPLENDPRCGPHGPDESLRAELIALARRAELLSPRAAPTTSPTTSRATMRANARRSANASASRIYDGPSEVHRWSLAKRVLRGGEGQG
jgi:hypothetical protein